MKFNFELERKPEIFTMNDSQTMAFIAAKDDVLFVNFKSEEEIDIDSSYYLSEVKACHHANEMFFILANKCEKVRGVFILMVHENNLDKGSKSGTFLIKWKNQLEIGDGDIYVVNNSKNGSESDEFGDE